MPIPILLIETQRLTKYFTYQLVLQTLKSRLDANYDLVRLYHPDKAVASSPEISPDEAHARFQAITAAYDALRGKTALSGASSNAANPSMYNQYQTTAAYRAMQCKRQDLYDSGAVDDSRTDKLLIAGIVATVLFVLVHNITTRREVVGESISRSRIIGAQTQSQRIREAEERLSMVAVEQVNNSNKS